MELISANAKNFMCFENLSLSFDDYHGIVGVFGANGAGKSSIFEAIFWGITGKTLRKKLSPDDVVHDEFNKNTFVRIVFKKNNYTYIINRYRKHREYNNMLFFGTLDNENELTKTSNAETQKVILDVIGLNIESLRRVCFFGSDDITPLVEMTDAEIKDLLEDVLGFNVLDDYLKVLKQQKKEYDPIISKYQTNIVEANAMIKERKRQYESTLTEARRLKKELQYKASKANNESYIDVEPYELKKKQLIDKLHEIHLYEEKFDSASVDVHEAKNKLNEARDIYRDLVAKGTRLKAKIEKMENYEFPESCDKCGRKFTVRSLQEAKRVHKSEIRNLKSELKENEKNIKFADKQRDKVEEQYNEIYEYYGKLKALMSQKNAFQQQVSDIEKMIENAHKHNKMLSEQEDYYKQLVQNKRDEMKQLRQGIKKAKDYLEELQDGYDKVRERYDVLQELLYILGNYGVKDIYLDNIFPFLNEVVLEYISSLGDIDVSFEKKASKKGNKFNINIVNHNGAKNYYGNSSGEKVKIDLASSLAFQAFLREYLQIETNVLFLDEPFESLDEHSSETVLNLLTKVSEKIDTVFLISHNDSVKQIVDDVIYLNKQGKVTNLGDATDG